MATVRLQLRRGTDAQWVAANPILAAGELGVETDTRKVKIGDGTTAWNSLDYIAADNPEISEIAQDAIDAALVAGTGITKSYDDNANTITVSVDTSVIATKEELAEVAQDSIDQALTAGTGITKNYDDAANTLTVSVDTDVIATKASPTFTGTVTLPSVNAGGNIIPSVDNTYDLGSPDKMWRDVYVGPGSIYVNGQKVLETDNGDVVVTADVDENLSLRTTGSGSLELNAQGSGNIQIKSAMSIAAGENITSSDGNPIHFASPISTDSITSHSADTDLTITGSGTGKVYLNDNAEVSGNLTVGGNLTVSGSVTSINTETLNVADNIIDLNSNFTSGNPTENAGIKVKRGDEADVQFRWNETSNAWEFTNDGASYTEVSSTSYVDQAVNTHDLDTTDVHGIADTSILVTTTGSQTLTNKTLNSPVIDQPTGITKSDVGLSNVDNTSDINKPISTDTQTALNLKSDLDSPSFTGVPTAPTAASTTNTTQIATTAFVTTAVNNLVDGAPDLLNTLNELAAAINDDESFASSVTQQISTLNNEVVNNRVHVDTFNQHVNDTENVHGILNTADLVYTTDARLSDERTPLDASVGAIKLSSNSVETDKITDLAVTTAKINDLAVTTAKINDLAITTVKLANDSVTLDKLADNSVQTQNIVDENVTTAKIADNAVTASKLSDNSVDSASIIDNSVTESKILNLSVTTSKIADQAVTEDKIGSDAITSGKILNDSVISEKILDSAVTTNKINDLAITDSKLASDSVTTIKIADSAVTSDKLANGSVTENKLATDSVTTGKIADSAVTSDKIANETIVDADINASAAIAQSKIANLTTDLAAKALDADLDSHTGATTSVHGIADTSVLVTLNGTETLTGKTLSAADNTITINAADIVDVTATAAELNILDGVTATAAELNVLDGVTASTAELNYVDGVTSAIQTQLDSKASLAGATFTGSVEIDQDLTVDGNLTVNGTTFNASSTSIVIEDNMVQLAHQNAANTVDLGLVVAYNDGSAKHAGIVRDVSDAKWKLFKGVATEPSTTVAFGEGSLDDLAVASFEATSATIGDVSNTELQYLNGVTSAIQTQIDAKAPTASPTFTGTVTVAASGISYTDGTQTKAGVPSLTTIASATTGAYNLSTGGLALRDQLIPIGGTHQITVPTNATTAYPIGTSISFYQSAGTGGNFAGASGVTVLATPGATLRTTYSSATITKVATDTWLLVGDLKA